MHRVAPRTEGRLSAPRVDDAELVRAWQRGDQNATDDIGRLYDRYVLRMALSRPMSRSTLDAGDLWWTQYQEARDLAQESWKKACRKIGTFRGDCRLGTWLYRIVKHTAIDRARQEAKRRREAQLSLRRDQTDLLLPDNPDNAGSFDAEEFFLPEACYLHLPTPEKDLLANERAVMLRLAIHSLPTKQKDAFIARYWTELEIPQIAKVLGVSIAAVIDRLERARETLRARLPASYRRTRKAIRQCDIDEISPSNLVGAPDKRPYTTESGKQHAKDEGRAA